MLLGCAQTKFSLGFFFWPSAKRRHSFSLDPPSSRRLRSSLGVPPSPLPRRHSLWTAPYQKMLIFNKECATKMNFFNDFLFENVSF